MQLAAQLRDSGTKLAQIRQEGLLPIVVYGAKQASTMLSVSHADFLKLFKEAGETTVIDLVTPNGTIQALVHEIQKDPATHKALHVDFLAVDAHTVVSVAVPIEFVGESPAVKAGLGVLNTVLDEIEVEALPKDIPQKLVVDLSVLVTAEDQITVGSIALPAGVTAVLDADAIVAGVSDFAQESESSGEIDFDTIEVEKKGKKEEESAE